MVDIAEGLHFKVDADKCIGCGACVIDCVADVLEMRDNLPVVAPGREGDCFGCQHCLAVCPTGAASVLGLDPEASPSLAGLEFDADDLDLLNLLVRGRRSCRQFSDQPVAPELLDKLLRLVAHAPTGVNTLGRHFAVIRDRDVMRAFREKAVKLVVEAEAAGKVPEDYLWIPEMARSWLAGGKDEIFRDAPHLLVVSTAKDSPCAAQDGVIALSYFDILANAHGLGTVWAGLPTGVIMLAPELRKVFAIPDDHESFYCMLFGNPVIAYRRGVQREAESVHFVTEV